MKPRLRWVRMCLLCRYITNRHPEEEHCCPNDGSELVLDPEAPPPKFPTRVAFSIGRREVAVVEIQDLVVEIQDLLN